MRISLSDKHDENLVTVFLRTKFSAKSILVLGKAISSTGLVPSFLSTIVPDTPGSAKVISKLFTTGTVMELFRFFQDIYVKGLDGMMAPGTGSTNSEFVTKLKVLTDKVLKVIEFDKLFPGLPSGIKHTIKDKVGTVLETVLKTP
ncbi:MAG: hypothetical protein KAH32_08235, partial [Chlamydiia bacterium]|nr:hypothetical protein [Chlamydiia bacterium]